MESNNRISQLLISCLIIVVLYLSPGSVAAGELGHYMPGVPSIRDFALPSQAGFYYLQYNLYYTTDTYKDRNGNSVDSITNGSDTLNIEADVDAIGIQPTFVWVTDWKFLGASYGAFVGIPIANSSVQASLSVETRFDLSVDENQWGLGDIYVRPIWLGWNTKHFGISLSYGFYAPTGKYDDGDVDNTGLGFWTHEFEGGITWYPWEHQGTALMLTGTYEIHHKKEGADITPGNRFSMDWGISQYLPLNKEGTLLVELGIAGYSQWQVSKDSGSDVIDELNVKDQVHGIGGQVGLAWAPWNASLIFRYISEYSAEARFEGDLYVLTLVKGF